MDWQEVLEKRIKARRQILFSKEDEELSTLTFLIREAPRRAVVLWALELAEERAELLKARCPQEDRPLNAVSMARMWAAGEIKMPVAKRAILECHAFAKELSAPADIASCHAIGQACATVHANGHAIGYPIYDLTAMIREGGLENCNERIRQRMADYVARLSFWRENCERGPRSWADFLK